MKRQTRVRFFLPTNGASSSTTPETQQPLSISATTPARALTDGENLAKATEKLLTEQEPRRINALKSLIYALIHTKNTPVYTPMSNGKTVLQNLNSYYDKTGPEEASELYQYLNAQDFTSACIDLFQQRWGYKKLSLTFKLHGEFTEERDAKFSHTLELCLCCDDLAEAALVAKTLEMILHDNYGIPYRSATKIFAVVFSETMTQYQKSGINLILYFKPEDFMKINTTTPLTIADQLLWDMYTDKACDLYDYCSEQYAIVNTRSFHQTRPAPDTLQPFTAITNESILATPTAIPDDFKGELLLVTRTRLGAGNFMNARLTVEGLCRRLPGVTITWIVANDGDIMPMTGDLPPQVTYYETDALWKVYPVIQAKSLTASVIISIPSTYLIEAEINLPSTRLVLPTNAISMVVHEYNQNGKGDAPLPHINLHTGLNAGEYSLGLHKPELLNPPASIEDKLAHLRDTPDAAALFHHHPSAPLYFGYAYQPIIGDSAENIQGIKTAEILAVFTEHAKRSGHAHIKIVLPTNTATLQEAIAAYPTIFSNCNISYTKGEDSSDIITGEGLSIEVFNGFPFKNATFRALMDYAAAHNTPLVTTGDQSFMELFFSHDEGFVFMYQLMGHKKDLFDAIKLIAATSGLTCLEALCDKTERGLGSEESQIISLVEFLMTNQEELKHDSIVLKAAIQSQPALCDRLSSAIVACVMQQRAKLTPDVASNEPTNHGSLYSFYYTPGQPSNTPPQMPTAALTDFRQ